MPPNDEQDKNLWEASPSVGDAMTDAVTEIFKDPDGVAPDAIRVNPFMRWMNFLVIILALGLIVGAATTASTYYYETRLSRSDSMNALGGKALSDKEWAATARDMRRSFALGFGLGGAIGLTYMIKCLIRKVDP